MLDDRDTSISNLPREEKTDEFERFFNKIVVINTDYNTVPYRGRIVELTGSFIHLERRDGRIVLVRRKAILGIEAVINQEGVQ